MLNNNGETLNNTKNEEEDPYGGFNDYQHAYDFENVYLDKEFVEAANRSSYGRRPTTASRGLQAATFGGGAPAPIFRYGMHTPSSGGERNSLMSGIGVPKSSLGMRASTRANEGVGGAPELVRPMTAVRAAGYSSAGRKSTFEGLKSNFNIGGESTNVKENSLKEKLRELESGVNALLEESIIAFDEKNYKKALDKAKEAGRKERAIQKFRTTHSLGEPNLDLTLTVLLNLAQQYIANNMLNQSLHVYHAIVKNKTFPNAGRLKVNIGNVYFRKKDYPKAVKYYRMAVDQVPKVQQRIRTKMMNNIGVGLVKLGKYEDALATFEDCLDANGDYDSALNFLLAAYCLDDAEKMREAFQRLVDIPLMVDDDVKDGTEHDILSAQYLSNDPLAAWERRRKQIAERTILMGAKIISQSIAPSFAEGYAWCVETIKQSVYASLAIELEINKAVELLKNGDVEAAVEALSAFNNRDSKVASTAANNLAIINIMRGPEKLSEAMQCSEQALSLDRYNFNALVNRRNVYYLNGETKLAQQCYREALQMDASCVQAIYNLGLIAKEVGDIEDSKRHFYKLNDMLLNNVQVLIQLASIYELEGDTSQAVELYTQANNLVPTDPAILARLAAIYDAEGDKSQAFQCYFDSYRYFPSNIDVIKWLGNYYLYAQFAEKAVNYFEKAALMEPNNIEWQLLIGSCHRRSGNYHKAIELYKHVHRRFPNNFECLKFLVQLCKDLQMSSEEKEYAEKLQKLEKFNQLKQQRDTDRAQTQRRSAPQYQHQHSALLHGAATGSPSNSRPVSSRNSLRSAGDRQTVSTNNPTLKNGQFDVLNNTNNFPQQRNLQDSADKIYKEFIGSDRPMTSSNRNAAEIFENDNIDDLLPD